MGEGSPFGVCGEQKGSEGGRGLFPQGLEAVRGQAEGWEVGTAWEEAGSEGKCESEPRQGLRGRGEALHACRTGLAPSVGYPSRLCLRHGTALWDLPHGTPDRAQHNAPTGGGQGCSLLILWAPRPGLGGWTRPPGRGGSRDTCTRVAHSKHLHPLIAQQALTKQPSKQKSVDPTRLREKRKGKEGGKEETVESEISRAVFTLIFAPGVS